MARHPTIEGLEESIMRSARTDSEGRFLVWIHPDDVFWVIAPLDGSRAILAKEVQAPTNGEEVTWNVPAASLTVNLVDASGQPVEFMATIQGRSYVHWTPQAWEFDASSSRGFIGTQAKLEHLTPGTRYVLFAAGTSTADKGWISVPGQSYTCPEQGGSPTIDLIVKPISE